MPTYKVADVQEHASRDDCWVVVNGKVYNVTEWVPKHPGGDLILLCAGGDASTLFESYHPLSVRKVLSKFLIGELADSRELGAQYKTLQSEFYTTLKKRVEEYFRDNKLNPRVSRLMYTKAATILGLLCVAWSSTFAWSSYLPAQVIGALFLGYMLAHVSMSITHDGNHGSFSTHPVLSDLMGQMLNYTGASSHVWKYQHQIGHHAYTNVDGYDPDIRVSGKDLRRVAEPQPRQSYHRFQHLYLIFAYALFAIKSVTIDDVVILLQGKIGNVPLKQPKGKDLAHLVCGKLFYIAMMFGVPMGVYGHSFARVLLLVVAAMAVEGMQLAFLFQVAHVVSEVEFPVPTAGDAKLIELDWAAGQVLTTTNFSSNSMLWNTLSGGLGNQIEHHLFPAVSHVYYPRIAPIVERTCAEFDIPYKSFPTFWSAVRAHFMHLKRMGQAGKVHVH